MFQWREHVEKVILRRLLAGTLHQLNGTFTSTAALDFSQPLAVAAIEHQNEVAVLKPQNI